MKNCVHTGLREYQLHARIKKLISPSLHACTAKSKGCPLKYVTLTKPLSQDWRHNVCLTPGGHQPNGQVVSREWLIYSPSQTKAFCFACRFFSNVESAFSHAGFNDWKHSSDAISQHGCSTEHRNCMLIYCRLHDTDKQASLILN